MILPYLLEHNRYCNILGILVILFIAFLFSKHKRAISFKLIVSALVLQFVTAYVILKTTIGRTIISTIADAVNKIYLFADEGSTFIFGSLADPAGPWSFIFAVKVLPIIIFFGALMSLLFYLGIVQALVSLVSKVVRPLLGTSGAETLCAISNSFLGQTEAPLLIRNYLGGMTKSEMLVVMVSGMGTISGAILAVFAAMGVPAVHLLTASVMAIPGSIMIAKILYPETEKPATSSGADAMDCSPADNALDAISMGTTDGLQLALNVGAMLIAFISLIALLNYILGAGSQQLNLLFSYFNSSFQLPMLSLNLLFGWLFAPFGYLLGFTGKEALQVGELLGMKVAVNELVAYGQMVSMKLSDRFVNIITYALCGFSNFSCIGIQIGGIGALVPSKRAWLSQLGLYAVLGGSLSNLLSAMIVGLLI
jgi:CNT family concentrative nucleoside transporter